jgi:hypothetical protein
VHSLNERERIGNPRNWEAENQCERKVIVMLGNVVAAGEGMRPRGRETGLLGLLKDERAKKG